MRSCVLFSLLVLAAAPVRAQYVVGDTVGQTARPEPITQATRSPQQDATPFWDRISLGGNFGANFGAVTFVDVSPVILYNVNDRLQIGPGLTYRYFRYRGGSTYSAYSTNQYGGRIFGRYVAYENVFLQAEMEAINIEVPRSADASYRTTLFNPFVGGGYRLPLGENGGVYLTALYNLNYRADLTGWIYPSPLVLRIGFAL